GGRRGPPAIRSRRRQGLSAATLPAAVARARDSRPKDQGRRSPRPEGRRVPDRVVRRGRLWPALEAQPGRAGRRSRERLREEVIGGAWAPPIDVAVTRRQRLRLPERRPECGFPAAAVPGRSTPTRA